MLNVNVHYTLEKSQHIRHAQENRKRTNCKPSNASVSGAHETENIFHTFLHRTYMAGVFHENPCTGVEMDGCVWILDITSRFRRMPHLAYIVAACGHTVCHERSMRLEDYFHFLRHFYPLPTDWNIEFFPPLCSGFCVLLLLVSSSSSSSFCCFCCTFIRLLRSWRSFVFVLYSYVVGFFVYPPNFFSLFSNLFIVVGRLLQAYYE